MRCAIINKEGQNEQQNQTTVTNINYIQNRMSNIKKKTKQSQDGVR